MSPFSLRPDAPADLTAEDSFGHKDYAATLADAARTAEGPFTLGLFGPWGSGKTSVLNATGAELANKETAAVIFDAWRYEGDALRREFLTDVAGQLVASGHLSEPDSEAVLKNLEVETTQGGGTDIRFSRETAFKAGRVAAVFGLLAWVLLTMAEELFGEKSVEAAYPAFIVAVITFLMTTMRDTIRVEQVQLRQPRLQDADQFARRFGVLLTKQTAQRVVICVDNLDRCSPKLVTELLGTIKTFLEPSSAQATLIFVVAADHEALRRHLLATEFGHGEEDRDASEDAVEEYLRKFFNGSIRMVESLDVDAADFTARLLGKFASDQAMSEESVRDLGSLINGGLKRNPRQINQFINNLALRLRLLRQREDSGRIRPTVSGNVCLVAMCLLIEQRWADRYSDLVKDPRCLDRWIQAASQETGDGELEELYRFLRPHTTTVDTTGVGAVIRLKQTLEETELDRWADFIRALDEGDSALADKILSEAGEDESRYAEAVIQHFERRRLIDVGEAVSTVLVTIEANRLGLAAPDVSSRVLTDALNDPAVFGRLVAVKTFDLIEVGAGTLPSERFNQLVTRIATEGSGLDDNTGLDVLTKALGPAVAPHVELLSPGTKVAVRSFYDGHGADKHLEAVVELAQEAPECVGERIATAALSRLSQSTDFTGADPAFEVLVAKLRGAEKLDHAVTNATLQHTVGAIANHSRQQASEDVAIELADETSSWLGGQEIDQAQGDQASAVLVETLRQTSADPGPLRGALINVTTAVIRATGEPAQEAASFVSELITRSHGMAVEWFEDELHRPPNLIPALRDALAALIPNVDDADEMLPRAARLLDSVEDGGAYVAQAEMNTIQHAHWGRARVVLDSVPAQFAGEAADPVINAVQGAVSALPAGARSTPLSVLLGLDRERIGAERAHRVLSLAADMLVEGPEQDLTDWAASLGAARTWSEEIVRFEQALADRVLAREPAACAGALAFLVTAVSLPAESASALATHILNQAEGDPDLRVAVLRYVAPLARRGGQPSIASSRTELLRLERAPESNENGRRAAFETLRELEGNDWPTADVTTRLRELASSDVASDNALAEALTPADDANDHG